MGGALSLAPSDGRAQDQLNFDLQVEVADRLGYRDHGGRRAVEHFMQDYFRHATRVGELTRIFLTALEATHVKPEPLLIGLLKGRRRRRKLRPGYDVKQGRLTVADEATFLADKLNLLRLFEEALRSGLLIHPDAMRLVTANLHLIDDGMRRDKEAVRIFLDLMLKHGNPERALRRMNELGVLAAFIPEFAPVVAMMQFNMYHSYTVDEHTIQVVSALAQIEREELIEELPIRLRHPQGRGEPQGALPCLPDPRSRQGTAGGSLRPRGAAGAGDLPAAGAEEGRIRHGGMAGAPSPADVRHGAEARHFRSAHGARLRQGGEDQIAAGPADGADGLRHPRRRPERMEQLEGDTAARALPRDGLGAGNRAGGSQPRKARGRGQARPARAACRLGPQGAQGRDRAPLRPLLAGLDTETQAVIAGMLREATGDGICIDTDQDIDRDATRVCFVLADHPGIFSRLAGALSLVGANVVDARTYTTKDGYATAVFWVQDSEGHPYEAARLPRLKSMIDKTLAGEVVASEALQSRDKIKKRERRFNVPTHITFDNDGSEIYTIIEVDTRDRPGLLYDLTKTLAASNIYISSAVIATYGEQVIDTFYVKDMFGLKLHARHRQEALEKKLREAIARVAKRAGA